MAKKGASGFVANSKQGLLLPLTSYSRRLWSMCSPIKSFLQSMTQLADKPKPRVSAWRATLSLQSSLYEIQLPKPRFAVVFCEPRWRCLASSFIPGMCGFPLGLVPDLRATSRCFGYSRTFKQHYWFEGPFVLEHWVLWFCRFWCNIPSAVCNNPVIFTGAYNHLCPWLQSPCALQSSHCIFTDSFCILYRAESAQSCRKLGNLHLPSAEEEQAG